MSIRMMSLVWELDLPDSEKLVLLALADCANDEGHCWPGMATLQRKCSKSDRTVQLSIRMLCTKGHLTRREVPGKGCNYTVHPIVRLASDPRSDNTPEATSPRNDNGTPPKPLRDTPEATSGKPSMNHKEPSAYCHSEANGSLKPEHVQEFWNEVAPRLARPKIRDLTPERRQLVRARIAQYSLEDFVTVFGKCQASPFLRGDRGRSPLTFDWIMKKANFQKTLEGNYDG